MSLVRTLLTTFLLAFPVLAPAQAPEPTALQQEAIRFANEFLDLVDQRRYDEALDQYVNGKEIRARAPALWPQTEALMRQAFTQREPRGRLSDRRLESVSGRGGEIDLKFIFSPEFPEKLRGNRELRNHLESIRVLRRGDGKMWIATYSVGG